jgi:hypothetical protein
MGNAKSRSSARRPPQSARLATVRGSLKHAIETPPLGTALPELLLFVPDGTYEAARRELTARAVAELVKGRAKGFELYPVSSMETVGAGQRAHLAENGSTVCRKLLVFSSAPPRAPRPQLRVNSKLLALYQSVLGCVLGRVFGRGRARGRARGRVRFICARACA